VLQFRPQGGTDWTTVGDPVPANGLGFFTAQRQAPVSGSWRAIWFGENYGFTGFVTSREALVKFER
jgi:hypothetical protein